MSKVSELLAQLEVAYEAAEAQAATLAHARAVSHDAVTAAQVALDAVKAEQAGLVSVAERESQTAKTALDRLRTQVNDYMSALTGAGADPRVSVK